MRFSTIGFETVILKSFEDSSGFSFKFFCEVIDIEGTVQSLRQSMATDESPLEMMFNTFCFILNVLISYLIFCPDVFVVVEQRLNKKVTINLKFFDVTLWLTNNYTYCPIS